MTNLENSAQRIIKWHNGKKTDPQQVQIYPTNKCNLRCIFCAQINEDYGYEEELTKKEWVNLTKELIDMNIEEILISGGGEPFLMKSTILEMMKLIKNNNIRGRIITNGTLLDSEVITTMVTNEWDVCMVSIDGSDSQTHDKLRGRKGSFGKIIDNLTNLNSIKDDFPKLEINFVLNKKNFTQIPEMIQLSNELKINSINFEPITVNNPYDKRLKLNRNDKHVLIKEIIPEAKEISEKRQYPKSTNLDSLSNIDLEKAGEMKEVIMNKDSVKNDSEELYNLPCYEPWLWPKIEANGDVWPCSTIPLNSNIKENTFNEIWFEKLDHIRDKISKNNLPDDCENCVTTHVQTNNRLRKIIKDKIKK